MRFKLIQCDADEWTRMLHFVKQKDIKHLMDVNPCVRDISLYVRPMGSVRSGERA